MNTPLNPDAVDRVAKALMDDAGYTWGNATEKFRDGFRHHARIALAVANPVVSSVEELDALSTGAVFLDAHGRAWQKWLSRYQLVGAVEMAYALEVEDYLPARVLYRQTEEATNGR